MPYYGVYIPVKSANGASSAGINSGNGGGPTTSTALIADFDDEFSAYVFRAKDVALDVLKQHKDARLREFYKEDEAIKYARTGYEVIRSMYSDVKTSTAALEKAAFRAPTKQELIEFRKKIEAGDYERVKSRIWDNPRYLVSSGDTPTTLKEGYRYNAMHVCAISKKPRIAELILQTVSDPKFVDLLVGKKNDWKMCKELCATLLDYYLNIPEKGRSETPLHLAAKIGDIEMIQVLTSYPECKMTVNSDGLLPKDIICSRASEVSPELCKKIESLLDECFYVPVLRSADSAIPPQIGKPFSANNPPDFNSDPLSPEVKIQALAGPMNKDQAKQFCRRWKTPPRIANNGSALASNNSFISPMKPHINNNGTPVKASPTANNGFSTSTAVLQRRLIFNSTPQRSGGEQEEYDEIKDTLVDEDTCAKQNGNNDENPEQKDSGAVFATSIENNNNVSAFTHTAKTSEEIPVSTVYPKTPLPKTKRDIFFRYREQKYDSPIAGFDESDGGGNDTMMCARDTPGYKERHIKITDTEKGLEVIGRQLAKEHHVEWREYWDFLNDFIDIASADGLEKLETYFAQRIKDAEMSKRTAEAMANTAGILNRVCSALDKYNIDGGRIQCTRNGFSSERNRFGNSHVTPARTTTATTTTPTTTTPTMTTTTTTPYTCVEKSLQVFAKRITKTIIHNIDNVVSINDTMLSELKRLKSLICSFKEDTRFLDVNFAKVHSRIGNLVSFYLENSQEVTVAVKIKIHHIIRNLLMTPGERREHIECVCSRIIFMLEHPMGHILPENLKTEESCSKVWLQENECDCQWETNLSRKASRRNRMEARYRNLNRQQEQSVQQSTASESFPFDGMDKWRNPMANNSCNDDDDLDDDVFWSDFGGSDTEDDDEDTWLTPPESPSRISLIEDCAEESFKIFVYGNEPTKRDLDVLNAIFHIEIDKVKYPNIDSWKSALLRYPNEEMDYFPSPAVVRKSHSLTMPHSTKKHYIQSPLYQQKKIQSIIKPQKLFHHIENGNRKDNVSEQQQLQTQDIVGPQQLSTVKSTFSSPSHSKSQQPQQKQQQLFTTPLNKIRGLFSAYRERLDDSPSPPLNSSTMACMSDRSDSDGSNNLSLLNVSSAEMA